MTGGEAGCGSADSADENARTVGAFTKRAERPGAPDGYEGNLCFRPFHRKYDLKKHLRSPREKYLVY